MKARHSEVRVLRARLPRLLRARLLRARVPRIRALRVHIAAVAAYTLGWLAMWIQPLFMAELLRYPHATATVAGLIMGGEVAALSLSSALCGHFATRVSFRSLLLTGASCIAVGNLIAISTQNIPLFAAGRLLCGIGEGLALMVAFAALSNSADPARAYAGLAFWSSPIATLAFYLAPAIGSLAGGPQTLPTLFLALAVLLPAALLMPGELQYIAAEKPADTAETQGARRNVLLIWLASFLLLGVDAATWPLYFVLGLGTGLSADRVNGAIALSIISSIVGSLVTMVVGTRFGRRGPFAAGLALTALGVVLMVDVSTPASFLAGINLTMFASYFVVPYFTGFAASHDPSGRGVAVVGTAGPLAFSLGTGLGGFAWEYAGRTAIASASVVACVSAWVIVNYVVRDAAHSVSASRADA